jgi:hypothetical protein
MHQNRHAELAEALKSGKEFIDTALERALAQRASGYDCMGEEILCSREGDIVRTRVSKPSMRILRRWTSGCGRILGLQCHGHDLGEGAHRGLAETQPLSDQA